jgi:hypothetical protein
MLPSREVMLTIKCANTALLDARDTRLNSRKRMTKFLFTENFVNSMMILGKKSSFLYPEDDLAEVKN